MEYVNIRLTLPVDTYIAIETLSKQKGMSRNKFLITLINSLKINSPKGYKGIKNAGFEGLYNEN